jgi:hypothetical protein
MTDKNCNHIWYNLNSYRQCSECKVYEFNEFNEIDSLTITHQWQSFNLVVWECQVTGDVKQ